MAAARVATEEGRNGGAIPFLPNLRLPIETWPRTLTQPLHCRVMRGRRFTGGRSFPLS